MQDKADILGVKINNINIDEALQYSKMLISKKSYGNLLVTPNPEIIVMALRDAQLKQIINTADIALPDGIGVILAARILNRKIKERAAGFDFMKGLLDLASKNNYSLYLLGSTVEVIEKARENIELEYADIRISGWHHGYLDDNSSKKVIEEINKYEPDILLTGMGVPRQEKFLNEFLSMMKVKLAVTVGGSFDVVAGKINRAPYWMQKCHLEWFYRLLQEPKRLGRMMSLPYFIYLVFKEKIGGFFSAE